MVLIFPERWDEPLLLLFVKSNALSPEKTDGSRFLKLLSDVDRN